MTTPTVTPPPPTTAAAPVLSARGLTKTYGTTTALAGVDVDLRPGESVAVMGASGSGKTTLLHCLAGIVRPSTGRVVLTTGHGPVVVSSLPDRQRSRLRRERLGFVFQEGLLIPELTAVENVALALMLQGVARPAAEQHAAGWLQHLGLAGMEQRRIGQLSGGQAQRRRRARDQRPARPARQRPLHGLPAAGARLCDDDDAASRRPRRGAASTASACPRRRWSRRNDARS